MLEHVVKAKKIDLVLRGVNMVVRILKRALDDESTRIPRLGGTGMV
jgi:hypothetical protein